MKHQQQVAAFIGNHDIETPPAYRLLDVVSELGEVAKEVNESTGYGTDPEALSVREEELGDALFALLALCERLDIESEQALNTALEKYEGRLDSNDTPASRY